MYVETIVYYLPTLNKKGRNATLNTKFHKHVQLYTNKTNMVHNTMYRQLVGTSTTTRWIPLKTFIL